MALVFRIFFLRKDISFWLTEDWGALYRRILNGGGQLKPFRPQSVFHCFCRTNTGASPRTSNSSAHKLIIRFFFLSLLLLAPKAWAGFVFAPALSFLSNSEPRSVDEPNRSVDVDFRLGYKFKFGLYIGGFYGLTDQEFDVFNNGNSGFLAGPTIGLANSGVYLFVTGVILGDRDLNSGLVKYTGARGLQIDLGYGAPLSKNLRLGPQITYRTIQYEDAELNGFPNPTDYQFESITPYITLWLQF